MIFKPIFRGWQHPGFSDRRVRTSHIQLRVWRGAYGHVPRMPGTNIKFTKKANWNEDMPKKFPWNSGNIPENTMEGEFLSPFSTLSTSRERETSTLSNAPIAQRPHLSGTEHDSEQGYHVWFVICESILSHVNFGHIQMGHKVHLHIVNLFPICGSVNAGTPPRGASMCGAHVTASWSARTPPRGSPAPGPTAKESSGKAQRQWSLHSPK